MILSSHARDRIVQRGGCYGISTSEAIAAIDAAPIMGTDYGVVIATLPKLCLIAIIKRGVVVTVENEYTKRIYRKFSFPIVKSPKMLIC